MIVRVVASGTESLDASREWGRERAEDLRALPGIERFDFVTQKDPPRAAAIIYYASREAYEHHASWTHLPDLIRSGEEAAFEKEHG